MREALVTLLLTVAACGGAAPVYCQPGAEKTEGCECPPADLAGTPAQICGGPDSLYSTEQCGCVGSERALVAIP